MHTAFIGTHGVGKTTVFERVKSLRPDIACFSSAVRHQLPAFGLGHLFRDVCPRFGIGAFQLFNMNAWAVIDPKLNSLLEPGRHVLTDRSVIDSMAYFLAMRDTFIDMFVEPIVQAIATHYARLYDLFFYFPHGLFPLVGDAVRPSDVAFQKRVDDCIPQALELLGVPPSKVHRLVATSIEARVEEVLARLSAAS